MVLRYQTDLLFFIKGFTLAYLTGLKYPFWITLHHQSNMYDTDGIASNTNLKYVAAASNK